MDKTARAAQRAKTLDGFDADENGLRDHGIFGLPFSEEESETVLLPVPWEVTVSYREGTSHGPAAILKASQQIDLYDGQNPGFWKQGIAMRKVPLEWQQQSERIRAQTALYLQEYGLGETLSAQSGQMLKNTNLACDLLRSRVHEATAELLADGKNVGVVGGDHSTPLGYLQALAERYIDFGILQIDAHADLREAYEGFTYSHASIMWNALKLPQISRLVQVGIRDMSEGEHNAIEDSNGRVVMFGDTKLVGNAFSGQTWKEQCAQILSHLPQKVYVSFDIDGLEPSLCPSTGTPVPGGLSLQQAFYLLDALRQSGRTVIGFDLCEVAPSGQDEWDGNVGARVLYKLCSLVG